jgi:hypothetical protein
VIVPIYSSLYKHCGWPINKVERLLKDDPDVLALWRKTLTPRHGGARVKGDSKPYNISLEDKGLDTSQLNGDRSDNVRIVHGTSQAYTASRLKRECPDQFKRVEAGELSIHAAAIEAGLRKCTFTIPDDVEKAVDALIKHFGRRAVRLGSGLTGC